MTIAISLFDVFDEQNAKQELVNCCKGEMGRFITFLIDFLNVMPKCQQY